MGVPRRAESYMNTEEYLPDTPLQMYHGNEPLRKIFGVPVPWVRTGSRFHLDIHIRTAIINGDAGQNFSGLFKDADGRALTHIEVMTNLICLVREGHEYIPNHACDNFDVRKGCQGHPVWGTLTYESYLEKLNGQRSGGEGPGGGKEEAG